ncbi:di-heme oxidoredictase family protein [Hahella sp. HN01]|uniref:di-heme oxidoredictase family protein n=1 Tax=Hahella sp. HN01 TaxID=2847262 RepID=UPI001C1EE82D|nr:di-heme oxidoredictase family protein [Hahella sp. HN01]MBU6953323.1 discoidin domain-containing protein [Hahella sp. HN01]
MYTNDSCHNALRHKLARTLIGVAAAASSFPAAQAAVNLAAGKNTFASTELRQARLAVDADSRSRWESNHGVSPSWLTVDLGRASSLEQVVIDWEAANPETYEIQGSNDNENWTTLSTQSGGVFGDRTDTVDVSGDYRYVRIFATQRSRGNAWGYSIFDLEVYGTPLSGPDDPDEPDGPGDPNSPNEPDEPDLPDNLPAAFAPLYPKGTEVLERIQYVDADGTLVTLMGARPTERHARERGEPWDAPDQGPGRYLTFPPFYFQNRTFGLEIRDSVPAGGDKIEVWLHVNANTFRGTTFSLFRNIENPNVKDFGWSLNYGFNNPNEGGQPICHAGKRECMMDFNSNWRTSPHSPLKVGDKIELAPAPRLLTPVIDGGGERYYSFEQLYVVGKGMRPWYGIAPNLDSEPLPPDTLLGGQASVSYNYSEEPHRMFQQMANNIGIENSQRFVEGRRLFHTSFSSGKHSEFSDTNPVFSAHVGQLGPRYNNESCISCHQSNGRSQPAQAGQALEGYSVLTAAFGSQDGAAPDPFYGFNVLQKSKDAGQENYAVNLSHYEVTTKELNGGEVVELRKPYYAFQGPTPELYSVRQAPQVIGMGLLEAVSEATILAGADENDADGDGVRGQPNWIKNPETGAVQLGRFGWKASKLSLRHQVGTAFLQDMGVTTPTYPSRSCQKTETDCHDNAADTHIDNAELDRVGQYLALLGVPAQRSLRSGYPDGIRVSPEHDIDPERISQGKDVFAQSGCVACHTATLKTGNTHPMAELRNQTIHPYTDLLLHDMGAGLADTLPQGDAVASMWRTPPLWGLGSLKFVQDGQENVRYLHDGRARTLDEAILWHDGEAAGSRQTYEALSPSDRDALKHFLNSL